MRILVIQKESLIPLKDNPRKSVDKNGQFKLMNLIKEHGFMNPLQVWREPGGGYIILCGNHRYQSGVELGMEKFPCIEYQGTRNQALARAVSDNKSNEWTSWDEDKLKTMLEEISESDIEQLDDLTGFSIDELDELLGDLAGDENKIKKEDVTPVINDDKDPHSRSGDLWTLGRHRLLCGDATDKITIDKFLAGDRVDMIFTDPPYGINIVKTKDKTGFIGSAGMTSVSAYKPIKGDDTTETARLFYEQFLGLRIRMIILGGNYFTNFLPPASCWLCWDKRVDIPSNNFADFELAWTNLSSSSRIYRQKWNGMWRSGKRKEELKNRVHPTQKPVGLAVWCLENYTKKGNIILDGFGGSGQTIIACEKTDRVCRMIEFEPHYCDVILQRWADYTGKDPVRSDGVKWSELCQSG